MVNWFLSKRTIDIEMKHKDMADRGNVAVKESAFMKDR
jgi:hypothetical protein